jgi:hypothetical protein
MALKNWLNSAKVTHELAKIILCARAVLHYWTMTEWVLDIGLKVK